MRVSPVDLNAKRWPQLGQVSAKKYHTNVSTEDSAKMTPKPIAKASGSNSVIALGSLHPRVEKGGRSTGILRPGIRFAKAGIESTEAG